MVGLKIKRSCQDVTCDICGNVFKQLKVWQAYCSKRCRRDAAVLKRLYAPGASMEVAELRSEVARLKAILDDAGIPY